MGGPKKISPLARFYTKFSIDENGCWIWTGAKMKNGYGRFGAGHNQVRFAHRWIYEQIHGKLSDGLVIDHLCRNPSCVNPEHLEAVTQRENILRGMAFPATNAKKTHCPQGHEYTPENTIISSRNQRHCRTCHQERDRNRKRNQRKCL